MSIPDFARGAYAHSLRRTLGARMVVVFDYRMIGRGYQLIPMSSRAMRSGDIHELIVTAEATAAPGAVVNDVAVLGFLEFTNGGVLVAGDQMVLAGREIGHVVGFDESHAPNHINIVLFASRCETGIELGAKLEDKAIFAPFLTT